MESCKDSEGNIFKVGDEVKIIDTETAPKNTIGLIGIIQTIDNVEIPPIRVYFESIDDYWYYYPKQLNKEIKELKEK